MRPSFAITSPDRGTGLFRGPEGSCCRVTLSWATAGGVASGGILVGSLTITGLVSPGLQLLVAPVLFLAGALVGAVHGGVLAVAGRPDTLSRAAALRRAVLACVVSVPALGAAWVLTTGISLTAVLTREWRWTWALVAAGAWALGLALCAWAAHEGWQSLRRAFRRWPDGRVGTALTGAILVASSFVFVRSRPEIWGTELRLNRVGALALALAVTLWVGLPLVWALLHAAHERHLPQLGGRGARRWSALTVVLLVAASCGGSEEAPEAPPEPQVATATAAETAAPAEDAPVRRYLPDELRRSTRAERFPHEAHVELGCRVCHEAPRGHTVHTSLRCADCHRASALATRQSLTPAECQACHHDPARNLPCAQCHGAPGPGTTDQRFRLGVWPAARTRALPFDHARHQSQDCATCHQDRPSMAFTRTCGSCHESHHRVDARCVACHVAPPATAHDAQAHVTCSGAGCHAAPDIEAINDRQAVCLVCHRAQEEHGGGRECVGCHTMRMEEAAW